MSSRPELNSSSGEPTRGFRSLTTKYIFLGLVILGLIISFTALSFWFTNHIKNDARRINLAGRQRMLNFEMAWLLNKAMKEAGGQRGKAAEILGIDPKTLYRKLLSYGVKE
jgi:nitrate/nitrite-specific signal transduction histidine kinase